MASLANRIDERDDMLASLELAVTHGGEWTKEPAALSPYAGDSEFVAGFTAPVLLKMAKGVEITAFPHFGARS